MFIRSKMGLSTEKKDINELKSEQRERENEIRGEVDFFDDRSRWQFLSKELA